MQVVVNGAYVSGKVKIGNYVHWASMALLIVGFILSLPFSNQYIEQRTAIFAAYAALIGALLLLNFGRSFTRRWGPKFRQDQWLIPNLKGLDNKSTLFNYASPVCQTISWFHRVACTSWCRSPTAARSGSMAHAGLEEAPVAVSSVASRREAWATR